MKKFKSYKFTVTIEDKYRKTVQEIIKRFNMKTEAKLVEAMIIDWNGKKTKPKKK